MFEQVIGTGENVETGKQNISKRIPVATGMETTVLFIGITVSVNLISKIPQECIEVSLNTFGQLKSGVSEQNNQQVP